MISPHTPPGTEVICVWGGPGLGGLPGLKVGELYTVDRIVEADDEFGDKFGVVVVGHGIGRSASRRNWRNFWRSREREWAYRLECFRYVELAGLDALLDARVKEKA